MNLSLNPYNRILYKLDDSTGWFYAEMAGNEKICERKCQNYKSRNGWLNYKLYGECRTIENIPEFKNCIPNAYSIHLTTNLIYLPELNKWYEPDEIIPLPTNKCEITDEFSIDFYFDEIMNDGDFDESEEPYVTANLKFKSRIQNDEICVIWDWLVQDVHNLIKNIQQDKFSNIIVEEWNYAKILAWTIEDKVRFVIQNYDNEDVKITFDALIDKQYFLSEFIKMVEQIEEEKIYIIKSFNIK